MLILLGILLISFTSACININTASLTELDELPGIGPVKGQAIIDTRPFNTVDDLINVYGIGPVTLTNIKEDGRACVEEEQPAGEITQENLVEEEPESNTELIPKETIEEIVFKEPTPEVVKETNSKPIILNTKDINSENVNEKITKNNYITYGLIGFAILITVLFLLRKNKYQNEFR